MVYKYYSSQDYNFDALEKQYFFFSKAKFLNDPFDTSLTLLSSENIKSLLKQDYNLSNDSSDIVDDYGVCCFSKSAVNKHLWALYSDNYKGFVLVLDDEKFAGLNEKFLARINYLEVNYIEKLPDWNDLENTVIKYEDLNAKENVNLRLNDVFADSRSLEKLYLYLFSLKEKTTWSVEEERRMIICNDFRNGKERLSKLGVEYLENGYKLPMSDNSIRGIIVGHNMSEENLKKIKDIAKRNNINDIKQTVAKTPFTIELEQL